MEQALDITVVIHGSIGVVCMVSGLLALLAKKRAGRHPKSGRVFSVSLALLFVAILPNLIVKQNAFLFGIGWLAVYAAIVGWRALLRFQKRIEPGPSTVDYTVSGLSVLSSAGLTAYGVWAFLETGNTLALVCVGFGFLGLSLVKEERRRWKRPPSPKVWLGVHIGMMMGAFSAAVTAFFAIQLSGKLGSLEWVVWVAPSVES